MTLEQDQIHTLSDEQEKARQEQLRRDRTSAEKKTEKKKLPLGAKIGIAAGAAVLALGGTTATVLANQEKAPTTTEGEAPGNPDDILDGGTIESEQGNSSETAFTPFSPELKPDQLGQAWVDQMNKAFMSGCNKETFERGKDSGLGVEAFLDQESETNGTAWANATYGPGWETNPTTHDFVYNRLIPIIRGNMQNWFSTFKSGIPFESRWVMDSQQVVSVDESKAEVLVTVTQANNVAESGLANEDPELVEQNGQSFTALVTFSITPSAIYEVSYAVQ